MNQQFYPIKISSDTGSIQELNNKKFTLIGAVIGSIFGVMFTEPGGEKMQKYSPLIIGGTTLLGALVGATHDDKSNSSGSNSGP